MKLTFQREPLSHPLQMLRDIANGRNTLPILSNVLIRADEGRIEFTATDLEVAICIKVDGTIHEEGAITVPAKKLADIVNGLPEQDIHLTATVLNQVELTCGNSVYKVNGLPNEEFPQLPTVNGEPLDIELQMLLDVFHKTEFAASTEENRDFLRTVYFNFLEDRTEVVATDGRRLALAHCAPVTPPEGVMGFLVPLKAVRAITRTFANSDAVDIAFFQNQVPFNTAQCITVSDEHATLTTRLVDSEYPSYERIIPEPQKTDGRIILNREAMLRATRWVSLLANPEKSVVCLAINEAKKSIRISAETPELGVALETVDVDSCTKNLRVGFNPQLLIDALSHLDAEKIQLQFSGELDPFVMRPVREPKQTYLVMPMKIEPPQVKIKVIGVGAAGGNAVKRMMAGGLTGLEFYVVDTNLESLGRCDGAIQVQIGENTAKGLGTDANPEVGRKAAEEDEATLETLVSDADMVLVIAGMGGGTGTGAAPRIASLARRHGALTVAVVTLPFNFEGKRRAVQAENGLQKLRAAADSVIVAANQHLITEVEGNLTIRESFHLSDDILSRCVQVITEGIVSSDEISIGFADIKSILRVPGRTAIGIGQAAGEERGRIVMEAAITAPLLEGVALARAAGLIVGIVAPPDFAMAELDSGMQVLQNAAPDAQIIFSLSYKDEWKSEDPVRVTVVATGLE